MIANRRGIITGLGAALVAAPAIVKASSLMPISSRHLRPDVLNEALWWLTDPAYVARDGWYPGLSYSMNTEYTLDGRMIGGGFIDSGDADDFVVAQTDTEAFAKEVFGHLHREGIQTDFDPYLSAHLPPMLSNVPGALIGVAAAVKIAEALPKVRASRRSLFGLK